MIATGCNSGTVLQLGKPTLQRHRHAPADRQTGSNQEPAASRLQPRARGSLPRGILKPFRVVSAAAHFRPRLKSWAFRHNRIRDYLPNRTCGRHAKIGVNETGADMRRATPSGGFQGPLI